MTKNGIVSKNHIKEIVARNPELLEKGLKLIDTDIELFAGDRADMLAVDKERRLVVLAFSAEPQTLHAKKGALLLKEALHAWNWLMYFKDSLLEETKKRTGIKLKWVPPRLAVVAPSFTKGLVDLAKMTVRSNIDLSLYTYAKVPGGNDPSFQEISLKSNLPPAPLPESIGSFHAQKIDYYWSQYGGDFTEARYGKGYTAYSFENVLNAVDSVYREAFKKMHRDILALGLNLRAIFQKDTVTYKDVFGNEVSILSAHEIHGFSLLVGEKLFYWGEKPGKDGGDEKTALATIKSYSDAVKKEIETTF